MARIGIIIIVLGVLVAGAASLAKQYYEADGPLEERIIVHIAKGSGVGAIADRLKFEGVISSEDAFKVAARLRGDGGQLKAGDYEFDPGVSLKGVMDALVEGAVARCTLGEMVQAMADVYGRYSGGPEW